MGATIAKRRFFITDFRGNKMAIYRTIQISFWSDPKVVDDFTPEDKYFYLYLFTNPHTKLSGCYQISKSQMSMELGYSRETIDRLLNRFQLVHQVILFDEKTKEILLLNWYRYNWTASEKFRKALFDEICDVKNESFKKYLVDRFDGIDTVSIPYAYGSDTSVTVTDTVSDTVTVSDRKNSKKEKAENIVEMYHIQCPSLPKVMKLTESRIRAINARLKEYTEEDIETAFVKAENSPFLRGEKGDWKANFDWIMKPGNLPKILEGNYDDREQVKKDSFDSMLEDWAKGGSDGKE